MTGGGVFFIYIYGGGATIDDDGCSVNRVFSTFITGMRANTVYSVSGYSSIPVNVFTFVGIQTSPTESSPALPSGVSSSGTDSFT